jgi:pimeloyl-ACP methyl ester carboxylesterase
MDAAGTIAVHRHNLSALMIADPAKVDDLAVYLQIENTRRARVRAGGIPASDTLLRALPNVKARIHGIWGRRDSMSGRQIDDLAAALRRFQPDLDFRAIDGAGHWTPYEAFDAVNASLLDMFAKPARG